MTAGHLLFAATLGMVLAAAAGYGAPRLWLAATAGASIAALAAGAMVLAGGDAWEWRSGFPVGGVPLHLRLDGVGAVFLVLLSFVGAAGAVYAHAYWPEREHPRSARPVAYGGTCSC